MKINYGCGENKLDGFVNIDMELSTKPDVVCDVRKAPLPFKNEEVDEIYCIHNLEHIELFHWHTVFSEFSRVLKSEGVLTLAYPEFEVAAKYFLENKRGMREFWRNVLYGRQLYAGDYHVVPMRTEEVIYALESHGFRDIKHKPEPEEWNTFLQCKKGLVPLSREDVIKKEIFV